jgi:hypothetical protein
MVITKKKKVGQIGGRYIYGIAGTSLLSVTNKSYEKKNSAQKNSKYKQVIKANERISLALHSVPHQWCHCH